jgi:hypothetical protein
MKNEYKRVMLLILAQQQFAESRIFIPSGDRIIAIASDGGVAPSCMVSIKIDENGNKIHPSMSYKLFDGSIGSFSQRGIELETGRGGDFTISANATEKVEKDTYIEMNFLVQTNGSCD